MPLSDKQRGQRDAGLHLRVLLRRPGPYRDVWHAFARDAAPGQVNQAAVCQVVARYLWDSGECEETDQSLPRRLKDKVHRALNGRGLSLQTLRWLTDAFELSPHDAQRVREIYRGDISTSVIAGRLPPPASGSGIRPARHETTLLFEHHTIGRDGVPAHHHTQQTIRSLADGLTSYQYRIDTPDAEIRVRRGGTGGPVYAIADDYYAVDIAFPHPLRYGEEHYLDYWTIFRYSQPPVTEFRRGTHTRVEHLDMRVQFHELKLPARLWWAQWRDYRDLRRDIVDRQEITLDEERSAHRYLEAIEHTIVGFYWEW
ncbi:MAG: hypothetical protein ACLPN6_29450 [Streptosporangiaceae bacterium]|jgi:hypothetical protein|nr:hypothetical protein [Actinomycetota bacterium]